MFTLIPALSKLYSHDLTRHPDFDAYCQEIKVYNKQTTRPFGQLKARLPILAASKVSEECGLVAWIHIGENESRCLISVC